MKNSTRLLIAVTLTLVMAIGAVGAWAGSARQGTVPLFPDEFTGSCTDTINFGTGIVTGEGTCELAVNLSADPGEAGALPDGWAGLFDYVSVTVADGQADGIKVCVPVSPDWKDKKAGETMNWYVWADSAWVEAETTIEKGTPESVCGYSDVPGTFTLLGK